MADSKGLVKVQKVRSTLPGTHMEFIVPTGEGDIRMSDYASVNGWQGSHVCTWLPKNKE
jgi:hypothetical protein